MVGVVCVVAEDQVENTLAYQAVAGEIKDKGVFLSAIF
jgi:hypothetical protein